MYVNRFTERPRPVRLVLAALTVWLLLALLPAPVATAIPDSRSRRLPDGRPGLPLEVPEASIRPLRQLIDRSFQSAFERRLRRNPLWNRLINQKRMAVGLVDLSDPENIRYARVNGNRMMYAASLPKLAILLAAEQHIADGRLLETDPIREDMRAMIARSDNGAATRIFNMVGGSRAIERVLRDPRYALYDPDNGGGLWVGKPYAKGGKRYPDPVMGTSHGASVTQVCRFYYLLAMGRLVDREHSASMLDMMIDPEVHHKFVNSLDSLAPRADVYRKSGTWRRWHSDSVLVWGPEWRRYIAVALIEDPNGERILRNLLPVLEEILLQQGNARRKS